MKLIEGLPEGQVTQLGMTHTPKGLTQTQASQSWIELQSTYEEVVHELGFHTDGCQVGVGCNYVPGHKREGAGLLVYWRSGHPGTFLFR